MSDADKSSSVTTAASLQEFAEPAESVAATSKKLEKAAILGAYLQPLNDADLVRATRYFAGQQFAQNDSRTTNVGGSIISSALSEATGFGLEDMYPRYVKLGDPGELAAEIIRETKHTPAVPRLTLAEVESTISRLSETRGTRNKTAILSTALRQASPLEGKYLVKLLAGDLRIGLREGLVEDALARAFGQRLDDVSYANMLLGDIGETAVRARSADLRNVSMRLFHPIKFMLATPAADLADVARTMPEEFLVEDKFDGIRAQAHVSGDRVAIYSRTMDEVTHRFPELISPLKALSTDVIIDGEIVPASADAILPFSELQKRLGRKNVGTQLLIAVPVILVGYDLLYASGEILINQPLSERRRILEKIVPATGPLRLSVGKLFRDAVELDAEFDAARARGNEGLMIKSPASIYK